MLLLFHLFSNMLWINESVSLESIEPIDGAFLQSLFVCWWWMGGGCGGWCRSRLFRRQRCFGLVLFLLQITLLGLQVWHIGYDVL